MKVKMGDIVRFEIKDGEGTSGTGIIIDHTDHGSFTFYKIALLDWSGDIHQHQNRCTTGTISINDYEIKELMYRTDTRRDMEYKIDAIVRRLINLEEEVERISVILDRQEEETVILVKRLMWRNE